MVRGGRLRRELWYALGAATLALLAWVAWPAREPAEPAPLEAAGRDPAAGLPDRWTPPGGSPAPPGDASVAAAHARLGEALGYVPIACYVGEIYDGVALTGAWAPRIEGGWYSDVVDTLAGERIVEMKLPARAPDERATYEHLFYVRWQAVAAGQATRCEVLSISRAELVVTVLDQDGAPVEGVRVAGCGASETTDAQGVAELIGVKADRACRLLVYCEGEQERVCLAGLPDEPLVFAANELRHLTVEMEVVDMGEDFERAADLLLQQTLARLPAPEDLADERLFRPLSEEIAVLEDLLAAAGPKERGLYAGLLDKKRRVQRLTALSAESAELRAQLLDEPGDPGIAEAIAEVEAERDALLAE